MLTWNPRRVLSGAGVGSHALDQSKRLFQYAVSEAGGWFRNSLLESLIDGRLILSGAPVSDIFAEARDIGAGRMRGARLDLAADGVTWPGRRDGGLTGVRIRRAVEPPADRSGGQSFRNHDAILIEKMRELIANGGAKNVTDAARQVAPKSKMLGTIESAEQRLARAYGVKYPTRKRMRPLM